jgi:hypothetical protein
VRKELGTFSNQEMQAHPGLGETSTETLKRPRSEDSNPTEMASAPKRPRNSCGPGTYKEALTNIKIAIIRETYPENKLTNDNQGRVLRGTPLGELPHLKSYRLEGGALICVRPTVWSMAHQSY